MDAPIDRLDFHAFLVCMWVGSLRLNAKGHQGGSITRCLFMKLVAGLSFACCSSARPNNRKLDIVIAHYNNQTLGESVETWRHVLQQPSVQALSPYVFLYCQNEAVSDEDLEWFAARGEVRHLANVGRESHAYIWHIIRNYGDLASHTLFHQDLADTNMANQMLKRLSFLEPQTGMLALGYIHVCSCQTCFISDIPKLREIWAMTQHSFCSPEASYPAFLRGAFVVSLRRIVNVEVQVYKSLLYYLEAPEDHWIHTEHSHEGSRSPSDPMSGHVLERSWNIIFDCMHLEGPKECSICRMEGKKCTQSACQCFDSRPYR